MDYPVTLYAKLANRGGLECEPRPNQPSSASGDAPTKAPSRGGEVYSHTPQITKPSGGVPECREATTSSGMPGRGEKKKKQATQRSRTAVANLAFRGTGLGSSQQRTRKLLRSETLAIRKERRRKTKTTIQQSMLRFCWLETPRCTVRRMLLLCMAGASTQYSCYAPRPPLWHSGMKDVPPQVS
jgi:hypothetical protein